MPENYNYDTLLLRTVNAKGKMLYDLPTDDYPANFKKIHLDLSVDEFMRCEDDGEYCQSDACVCIWSCIHRMKERKLSIYNFQTITYYDVNSKVQACTLYLACVVLDNGECEYDIFCAWFI